MPWSLDARIPVRLLAPDTLAAALAATPRAALLLPEDTPFTPPAATPVARYTPGTHPIACTCCAGRTPAAEALDRLFQARIRNQCAWFDVVLAVLDDSTLESDAVTLARFRAA